MRRRMIALALGLAAALVPFQAEAQQRGTLIEQSRAELPGSSAALDLLAAAANPNLAELDSLWSIAVYDMASNLIDAGDSDLASVWLRWIARHGGEWPIDRIWYGQDVESAYDVAAPAVETDGGLGDGVTQTTWGWPAVLDPGSPGAMTVQSADPSLNLTIDVQGGGTIQPGQLLSLPPGTYRITASADGYDPVQLSREILPGATTELTVDMPPQLPADVQTSTADFLARISFTQNGQLVCTNGVVANTQGLVLTTLGAVQNATQIDVFTQQGGNFTGYEIVRSDPTNGIAVLGPRDGPNTTLGPVPTPGMAASTPQYAWSVYQPGCADPTQARTRLNSWPDQPTSLVSLGSPLPAGAIGAPLVDRTGEWMGLVTSTGSVLPATLTQELIRGAVADLVAAGGQTAGSEGGGISKWVWIGGGVVAAGVLGAVVLGGGGGDTPPPPPPPTTGSLTIAFPPLPGF